MNSRNHIARELWQNIPPAEEVDRCLFVPTGGADT
jgi:hypothetical protein